jgi:5,10-methylenetetrahydromethanopterin reductase
MTPEFWRMGATPVPVTEIDRIAREMEADGWDGLAVGEAHGLLPDPYVALALAATATTTLGVGTAVAVPLRHPMLAADAMATVQGVSGGRASFSLARGDGAMKVLQRKPMPVAAFEAYLRQVQGFLRGDDVEIDGAVASMARLGRIDPSLAVAKPSVNVAATGPRMIAMAARYADGVSFAVGADLERLSQCRDLVLDTCGADGRDPDEVMLGAYVQVAVCDSEAERARACDLIRGLVMTHSRFSGFEGTALPDVSGDDRRPIQRSLDAMETVLRSSAGGTARTAGGAPGELEFYPREAVDETFIDRFGIVGSAEHCARRLQEILETGIARVYIGTRGVGIDLEESNTRRIGREVLPLVRRTGAAAAAGATIATVPDQPAAGA